MLVFLFFRSGGGLSLWNEEPGGTEWVGPGELNKTDMVPLRIVAHCGVSSPGRTEPVICLFSLSGLGTSLVAISDGQKSYFILF